MSAALEQVRTRVASQIDMLREACDHGVEQLDGAPPELASYGHARFTTDAAKYRPTTTAAA